MVFYFYLIQFDTDICIHYNIYMKTVITNTYIATVQTQRTHEENQSWRRYRRCLFYIGGLYFLVFSTSFCIRLRVQFNPQVSTFCASYVWSFAPILTAISNAGALEIPCGPAWWLLELWFCYKFGQQPLLENGRPKSHFDIDCNNWFLCTWKMSPSIDHPVVLIVVIELHVYFFINSLQKFQLYGSMPRGQY